MTPTTDDVVKEYNAQIAEVARRLCEAIRNFAYTRKDDDKKRIMEIQQELLKLCPA